MILRGRYVALHPLVVGDAEITQKWRTGGRARLLNKGAQTVEEQAAWIASRQGEPEFNFVQTLTGTGRPVGMISLVGIDLEHLHAEPAHFLVGEPDLVRGKPVAAEANLLIYQLAFDFLGLHRVYGPIASENRLMLKWHLALGMHEEGRLREHYWLDGRWQDAVMIGLLEDEYRAVAAPKLKRMVEHGL